MQSLDFVVIGGGVVGLAVAATLRPFGSIAVLERHPRLIHETSSRNSSVVHAGIYYPANSLKTQLSMAGNANLWRWQKTHPGKLRAKRIGKWIGTSEGSPSEEAVLEGVIDNMKRRGVAFEMVSQAQQRVQEPHVRMGTVVNSIHTGVIDVASLRDALVEVIEGTTDAEVAHGEAFVSPCAEVSRIDLDGDEKSLTLTVRKIDAAGEDSYTLNVKRAVVSAVGLHGNELWRRLFFNKTHRVAQPTSHVLHFCKGRYTCYNSSRAPVSRLVYPCPLPQLVGLGVHSTVDMSGVVRFGPDTVYTDSPHDYSFSGAGTKAATAAESELDAFVQSQHEAVSRYIPSIERAKMVPDFVGIRPKLAGPGEPFRDFLFEEVIGVEEAAAAAAEDGDAVLPVMRSLRGEPLASPSSQPRLVMATGIESPGLTASTAIGEFITRSLLTDGEQLRNHPPPWLQGGNP